VKIFFLSSTKPIIKAYELDRAGQLIKHNYPFIYEVTSHEEDPNTLNDLCTLMQRYAKKGSCLLKGNLARPLVMESRKGSTDSEEKTDWVCLDLDGIQNYQSVDLFLNAIGCGDTDYVLQWSSSMSIENNAGFRCHIFMQLAQPAHPQILKHWLIHLNLNTPALNAQLELTKTGNSLRWPLDITTCQNDKLLYIAPPQLGINIVDPFPGIKRISFIKSKNRTLNLPFPIPSRDTLRERMDTRITELRILNNLPKRKATKYKFTGIVEYMVNPDSGIITEMKSERGFTYFNINGGDSWAYYHPDDNPRFIFNFKGEPAYRTEDLLPEYWARIQQANSTYAPNPKGITYLAFRDFQTSNYFNGWFDANTSQLSIAQAKNEAQLRQFMQQHGQTMGEFVPDWNLVWDPHNPTIVNTTKKQVNTYQPSVYFQSKPSSTKAKKLPVLPPTIAKVISHVLGHDAPTIKHLLNWLAVIVQTKNKTGTAWVWHGTQGTGKGVLFHQILTPLFGEANVVSKRFEELASEFTGFMESKFLVFIDEIEAGNSLYHSKISAKLKNLIVEPTISIRRMYTPAYMAINYANMIFASNKSSAVEISPDDRRYNVGPYQDQPIKLTATEIDDTIPTELKAFYDYLMQYPADADKARTPLISAARSTLIDISRTAVDTVADAILAGDLKFLWDHLPAKASAISPLQNIRYQPFRDLMIELVTTQVKQLSREDLQVIMEWCVGNVPQSPHKFAAFIKHHRIHLTQVWKGRNVRGITVIWQYNNQWLAQVKKEIKDGDI
jgi:hypothetical protein